MSIQTETEQLESAECALRLIEIICTGNDPSDGEGTTPDEIVESVRKVVGDLSMSLRDVVNDWDEHFGEKICDCRPEPENAGHVCNLCNARATLSKVDGNKMATP